MRIGELQVARQCLGYIHQNKGGCWGKIGLSQPITLRLHHENILYALPFEGLIVGKSFLWQKFRGINVFSTKTYIHIYVYACMHVSEQGPMMASETR